MTLPKTPKIEWGTGFVNVWVWPSAPDRPVPRSDLKGHVHEAESGVRDFYTIRDDEELEIIARWVPRDPSGGVTGYSTAATGVREALKWMAKNAFKYYPDKDVASFHTCYLLSHEVDREEGGTHYVIKMRIRDKDGSAFTEY